MSGTVQGAFMQCELEGVLSVSIFLLSANLGLGWGPHSFLQLPAPYLFRPALPSNPANSWGGS